MDSKYEEDFKKLRSEMIKRLGYDFMSEDGIRQLYIETREKAQKEIDKLKDCLDEAKRDIVELGKQSLTKEKTREDIDRTVLGTRLCNCGKCNNCSNRYSNY